MTRLIEKLRSLSTGASGGASSDASARGGVIPAPHSAHHAHHAPPAPQTLLWHAVQGTLLWEASSSQARLAHQHLLETFADYNDLRVSPTAQIIACIGERSPLVTERALRLKAWLGDLFRRSHGLDLERLRDISRKEARAFLISLDGMPLSAAAYVTGGPLGGHYVAVDKRLLSLIIEEGLVNADVPLPDAARQIEEAVTPDQLPELLTLLRRWSDHQGQAPKRESFDSFKAQPIAPLEIATEESARKRPARRRGDARSGVARIVTPKDLPEDDEEIEPSLSDIQTDGDEGGPTAQATRDESTKRARRAAPASAEQSGIEESEIIKKSKPKE